MEKRVKLKKIILKAAAYYANQATARETGDETFDVNKDSNTMQLVINCEHLCSQLHNERELALRVSKEQSAAVAEAKEKHKRVIKAAKGFVGTVPLHQGVDASSCVALNDNVEEGLQLEWTSSISRQKINLPTNQKSYDNSKTTVGKLLARRNQICQVYFSAIIF